MELFIKSKRYIQTRCYDVAMLSSAEGAGVPTVVRCRDQDRGVHRERMLHRRNSITFFTTQDKIKTDCLASILQNAIMFLTSCATSEFTSICF